MPDLRQLDFGAPAAERDILVGLREYFYESDSYRRIKSGSKTVILGNRGSGKSAIFKMLAEHYQANNYVVIELAPEDYSYEMLSSIMTSQEKGAWAKQGAYAAAWKYMIYVLAMKKLLEARPALRKSTGKNMAKYLRDNHASFENGPINALISYIKRIEGIKIGPYEASLRVKDLQRMYKLEEVTNLLPELKAYCAKYPVVVLVDELDKGWDASEDAKSFVAGLFQASLSINQLTPDFQVLVSLRKELYDNIPSLY